MSGEGSTPLPAARRAWVLLVVTAAYLLLAVAWTWPYAAVATDHLPKGVNPTSLPASAGAWALWWVADRAAHGFVGLWEAPIFHPAPHAFGFSETTLPLGLAAAPLFWAGATPAAAYAAVTIGSLVGNGLAARWVAKLLGASELAAALAGAWLVACGLVWKWFAVLPLVPLFGMLLFVGAAVRAARAPTVGAGAAVGAAFALTWSLCLQYGLFTALAAPALLLLAPVTRERLRAVAVAGAVAAALLAPVLIPQARILAEAGMERSAERAEAGGASLTTWVTAPVPARLWIPGPPGFAKRQGTWPGTLLLGCVAAGIWARRRDRESLALLAVAGAGFAWSVAPTLEIGGSRPFDALREWVPGLERVREPRRAAALTLALLPVLAAPGLDLLRRRWAWAPGLVVAVALLNERPEPMPVQPTPRPDPARAAALRSEVPPDGAVLFLPFEDGGPTPEVDRMVAQAEHGARMVNGYSSYYPKSYWAIRRAASPRPQPRLWGMLREAGVTHLVAPPGFLPPDAPVDPVAGDLFRLRQAR